jgi:hypothetical protein
VKAVTFWKSVITAIAGSSSVSLGGWVWPGVWKLVRGRKGLLGRAEYWRMVFPPFDGLGTASASRLNLFFASGICPVNVKISMTSLKEGTHAWKRHPMDHDFRMLAPRNRR